jgi:hypothetical protein
LTLNGGTKTVTIQHGQSVEVGAAVTPTTGTTPPTGDIVLLNGSGVTPSTLDQFHLSNGAAIGSTSALPGSGGTSYSVWAHYGGDSTYGSSDSNNINLSVAPEPSTTTLSVQGSDLSGHPLTSPFPFASLVFVNASVAGQSGQGIPTGPMTFTDSFGPLPTLNPQLNPPVAVVGNPSLNSAGNTSIGDGIISFDAGNHGIRAAYMGDLSFKASSSASPVTFTVQPGFAVVAGLAPVTIVIPGGSGSTSVGIVASTGFSTAVTVTCSAPPSSEIQCQPLSITGNGPGTIVSGTLTVTTTAPHPVMLRSDRKQYYYAAGFGGGFPLAGIFLITAPKRRRWSALLGCMVVALLVTVPACGGGGGAGGGGGQPDPGTLAGTYTLTVTATAGSLSQQAAFAVIVK